MRRVLIVPRWGGDPTSDWYPWLQATVEAMAAPPFDAVLPLALPDSDLPRPGPWVNAILAALGDEPALVSQTILVGHSLGCRAALLALAALPPGMRVGGLLCVAAWWTVDRPWEALLPWLSHPLDLHRVRAAAPPPVVLLSDNDPYTGDRAANSDAWVAALSAHIRVVPRAHHFTRAAEPAVLHALMTEMVRARPDRAC